MNKQYPRFTVIIPQKNRAEYLIHTLRTCMIQDYPNFEIIVADDCSDDNSVEVVEELQKKDPRIKLITHDHHVGMRDNFEIALSAVKPGYVMALGGDDGLVPGCIWRMYDILKETGTELLTWMNAGYRYPMNETSSSILSINKRKFRGVKMIKSVDFLNKIAKTFNYLVVDCPMIYIKGVASTSLVNRVKSRTKDNSFYYCPTPDGFSGIVLAGEVKEYAFTCEPLSIGGDTGKSQGRNYKRTDEKSKKESSQFFNDNIRRTMHPQLASQPYSPLISLMTADYLLTARDLNGWPGEFKMFSFHDLIDKTFSSLINSGYNTEVLIRELKILKEIAIQHNEVDLFEKRLKNQKIKTEATNIVEGFFVTKNVYVFDSAQLNLNNIFEASLAVKFAYEFCNSINLKFIFTFFKRVVKMGIKQFIHKTEYLPLID